MGSNVPYVNKWLTVECEPNPSSWDRCVLNVLWCTPAHGLTCHQWYHDTYPKPWILWLPHMIVKKKKWSQHPWGWHSWNACDSINVKHPHLHEVKNVTTLGVAYQYSVESRCSDMDVTCQQNCLSCCNVKSCRGFQLYIWYQLYNYQESRVGN